MPFLHPLYLLGLISILSPLLIHFLSRRRAKVIPFSTLKFLLPSSTRRTFSLRLKEVLLLLLRILALLLLTFGIAQPVRRSFPSNLISLLVLDNSYSMYSKSGEPWKEALGIVREYINKGERVFLLTGKGERIYKKGVANLLSNLPPLYSPLPLAQLLEKAEEFLSKFPQGRKRVIVVSDMQKINFSGVKASYPFPIIFEKVGEEGENVSIENVTLEIQGTRVIFKLLLHNYSLREKRGEIQLNLGKKLIWKEKVKIPPEATISLPFSLSLSPGYHEGVIKLQVEDDLREDNLWFLSFSTFSPIKVLCINGRPSPVNYLDSTYYLSLALNPGKDENFYLQPVVMDKLPAALSSLSSYPLVFLVEWPALDNQKANLLKDYVNNGGILWIVLGKNLSFPSYNSFFPSLLPACLISCSEGDYHLKKTPNFNLPSGLEERVVFRTIISVKEKKGARILLYFSGGYPALIENKLGRGKVYLFTSSLSLSTTDFPLTPYYLPFIHESLAQILAPAHSIRPIFTNTQVRLPSSREQITLVGPKGREAKVKDAFIPLIPGIYHVNGIEGETFAVNSNREESNLKKISKEEVKKEMNKCKIWAGEEREKILPQEGWGNLLLLAGLFILGMESILANSFLPSEREKRKLFLGKMKK